MPTGLGASEKSQVAQLTVTRPKEEARVMDSPVLPPCSCACQDFTESLLSRRQSRRDLITQTAMGVAGRGPGPVCWSPPSPLFFCFVFGHTR